MDKNRIKLAVVEQRKIFEKKMRIKAPRPIKAAEIIRQVLAKKKQFFPVILWKKLENF